MATLIFKVWNESGNLADADSVPVLCDKTSTYGIKRDDSGSVIVPANTPMVKTATGTYQYAFVVPQALISYTAWVKVVYQRKTTYYEVVYIAPGEAAYEEVVYDSPSHILAHLLIEDETIFSRPSLQQSWPLYENSLPDEVDIAGAIYDTPGIYHGRLMIGSIIQHFGIQLTIRTRSKMYKEGWQKINEASSVFDRVHNTTVVKDTHSYQIQAITRTSPVIPLGREEGTKQRYLFTANFICAVKQIS